MGAIFGTHSRACEGAKKRRRGSQVIRRLLPGMRDMPLVIVRSIYEEQVCLFLLAQTPHALNADALTHRATVLLKQTRIAHGMSAPRTREGHGITYITCFVQVTTTLNGQNTQNSLSPMAVDLG